MNMRSRAIAQKFYKQIAFHVAQWKNMSLFVTQTITGIFQEIPCIKHFQHDVSD